MILTTDARRGLFARVGVILSALLLGCGLAYTLCYAQADGEDVVIGTYRMVPSRILGEDRRILVHLPRDYEESGRSYPVIFKLHGAPLGFFAPISTGLDLLAESGRIPPAILVGVEQHGHLEVKPRDAGGPPVDIRGEEFLRFLSEELLPFVDQNYRTKELRILMGSYECGLFTIYTLVEAPELFPAYLANSLHDLGPGAGAETVFDRALPRLMQGFEAPRFLYITEWRGEEGQADPLVDDFISQLNATQPKGLAWGATTLPHPSHDEWSPYKTFEFGMLAFFEGYECPPEVLAQGLAAVEAHYAALSSRIGVDFEIPERAFIELGGSLMRQRRWGRAVEVLEFFRSIYPRSLNAVFQLSRAYRGAGEVDQAIRSYRASLEFENCPPFVGEEVRKLETSAAFALEKSMVADGLDAALVGFTEKRSEGFHGQEFRESECNEVGYRFLGKNLMAEAIAVFHVNVEMFPESANAYDSLGEAYAATGDTTLAIESYRSSLNLNPENTNAQEMLRRLGESE
ncbi:alpha/beta hydrolase-fold protein [Candidatus Eisenbacteria bacterium]|uniref:Alpha/beta hydrolase-fold protein n=1 Tax=Eiseniibacteriota bacterium TaxID=2212470 RepID=A0ABV6YL67_UNCEI